MLPDDQTIDLPYYRRHEFTIAVFIGHVAHNEVDLCGAAAPIRAILLLWLSKQHRSKPTTERRPASAASKHLLIPVAANINTAHNAVLGYKTTCVKTYTLMTLS